MEISADYILSLLDTVMDPEIPAISVVDLGIIGDITFENNNWKIEMIPTFAGCPALERMQNDVKEVLSVNGIENASIKVIYNRPWSSNMVTEKGKKQLKQFGLSPPPAFDGMLTLEVLQNAVCPCCDSTNTKLLNPFGPTACRAIHHCNNCKETFEQFKPV